MTRAVLYVCHPLGGNVASNLQRAMRWLSWLRRSFPETTFVAPWIAAVLSDEDDADPEQREAGLVDACAVVALLDGVVLVGGLVSDGMALEAWAAKRVYDLTKIGDEPPGPTSRPLDFEAFFLGWQTLTGAA